jgi:hypothetical protein
MDEVESWERQTERPRLDVYDPAAALNTGIASGNVPEVVVIKLTEEVFSFVYPDLGG